VGTRTAAERLAEVASSVLGRTPEPGSPLGADSLETAELVFALEEEFGVRLPDEARFDTLADASDHVTAARGRQAPETPALDDGIGHLQWLADALIGRLVTTYYRLETVGAEHVPAEGPAVLATNHDSLLDIPLLAVAVPRRVWFMAKVELFHGTFATWFFHGLGGFPVRRGGDDLRAVRAAIDVVERDQILAMYPEGTRAPHLQPFLPGAAWVALATGAPLFPVAISGTAGAMPKGSRVPRRTEVRVWIDEPMDLGRVADPRTRLGRAREATTELRARVERMLSTPSSS
jgi:1-acyl-sn-glycerol-3-phosphate acyltransferase